MTIETKRTVKLVRELDENGKFRNQVSINYKGIRLGSIFGETDDTKDEFELKYGIVRIVNNNRIVAIIWDAEVTTGE